MSGDRGLLEEIAKFKESGKVPTRSALVERFRTSRLLVHVTDYFTYAVDLLQKLKPQALDLQDRDKNPFETVVFWQYCRTIRYLSGLHFMRVNHDEVRRSYLIDSYYPILKALFELFVEYRLAKTYLLHFGNDREKKMELYRRIENFTKLQKEKNNFTCLYYTDWSAGLPESLISEGMRNVLDNGRDQSRENFNKYVNALGAGSAKEVKHWFPPKDRNNQKFGKSHVGSMQWRCEDVLGKHAKTNLEQQDWSKSYKTYYDLVNRYSHPVLGYDDNLRDESERMFDLFNMLCVTMMRFDNFILPGFVEDLQLKIESNKGALEIWEILQKIKKEVIPTWGIYSLFVNSEDYVTSRPL